MTISKLKRNITESAISEQTPKRQKVVIKTRTWTSLWEKLELAQTSGLFKERIAQLQGRCSVVDKATSSMWIQFDPDTFLFFTICRGAFKSDNVASQLLENNRKNKNNFFRLTLNERNENEEKTELLTLLVSPNGAKGELEWISKGENFTGTRMLAIFERIQQYLQIQTLYLYDDAKFKVFGAKTIQLIGHLYIPIASRKGEPFYCTWANFQILECRDIPHPQEKSIRFDQNIQTFKEAVNLIKKTRINEDFRDKILMNYPTWQLKVDVLMNKINQSVLLKPRSTMGKLFSTLSTELREEKNQDRAYHIASLLQASINLFLRYTAGKEEMHISHIKAYENAVTTLEFTRLFVRVC